jgi:hypothetical protein
MNYLATLREKNNIFSPGHKARKGVWGKKKQEHEVLCDLCVSARENKYNLAEAQSTQRCFGLEQITH